MAKSISLKGKLLIAMPTIQGDDFSRSVVFLCAHNKDGAMGLVLNKPEANMVFADLIEKMNLKDTSEEVLQLPVMRGGPVKPFLGFVLHSTDYKTAESLKVSKQFALTATLDVLQAIALEKGPRQKTLAVGYAGWDAGQLESEILHNGWLHCDADEKLIFETPVHQIYDAALAKIGISAGSLTMASGRA